MSRRKKSRGLGYRRGGMRNVDNDYRRAVLRRNAHARKNCPMLAARIREAIDTSLPTRSALQPVFFHRLKLAMDRARNGDCSTAYREIGAVKRWGKRHQRSDD